MKKKLYGSILLIGGGLGFSQASQTLKSKLEVSLPHSLSSLSDDTVEVCSNPRVRQRIKEIKNPLPLSSLSPSLCLVLQDLDPSNVSWRGGAVLAALDCCQELWIERQEWELFGVRLLREKSLFVW